MRGDPESAALLHDLKLCSQRRLALAMSLVAQLSGGIRAGVFVAVVVVPIAAVRLDFDQTRPFGQLAIGIRLGPFGEREVEQLHRRVGGEGEEEVEAVGFEGVCFHEYCEAGKGLVFIRTESTGAVEEHGQIY